MATSLGTPYPPTLPDFHLCDRIYGLDLKATDCSQARDNLLAQVQAGPYYTNPRTARGPSFPIVMSSGQCTITVDAAGPTLPTTIPVYPVVLGNMAYWVVTRCTIATNGLGGFVTSGLSALQEYTTDLDQDPRDTFPSSTSFITLTVSGPSGKSIKPGDTDPSIPLTLANYENVWVRHNAVGTEASKMHTMKALLWRMQAQDMKRGGSVPWWRFSTSPDDMTYECDPNLGSPSVVDCSQIEWQQIDSVTSDTLTVGPSQVSFYHSNSCYLAISSTVSAVLAWTQVQTALSTLMNVCVQNPMQAPQGGRAFYGVQSKPFGRRRKRQSDVTGWNALPPGILIALYQQDEPWVDPTVELKSCTWDAVVNRHAIDTCPA